MKWSVEKKVVTGGGIALAVLLVNALISYRATRTLIDHDRLVTHTHTVLLELEATLSAVKDAETGVRGFIITGDESFLETYQGALDEIPQRLDRLRQLTADNVNQQARIPVLEGKIAERVERLKIGIDQRRSSTEGANKVVVSSVGKRLMDSLRQYVDLMEAEENDLLKQRSEESRASGRNAFLTDVIPSVLACVLLSLISYVIIRDITERKRSEEALRQQREWFRTTLSSIGDAVIATDTRGDITFLNPVAQSLTRWTQEEAENRPLLEVFKIAHEQTREPVENPALRAMEDRTVVGLEGNTVLIAKDGTEIPIDDSGAPIKDSEGNLLGAVLIFRDIAERRQAEQDRAQLLARERAAREEAEAASRAKDEFVAMVSHEIRSPLNAMLGWSQMLRTGKLDQEQTARAIETIERNAKNQAKLVEDLLDISRVVSGKLQLSVRPVDAVQVMEIALDSIRPAAEAKTIQLQLNRSPRTCVVSGDPDRLQQVVWNLLSNAVKFTPRGGHIDVEVQHLDSNLKITVSDSGAGISPEFLPYVFDRFSQANTTTERKHSGLGLGLAIVRHLVELHGGAVSADSAGAGKGATFTVTLPASVVASARAQESEAARPEGPVLSLGDAVMFDGLRVLIVDDDPGTRDLLSAILVQRGAEVRSCSSAAEALQAIGEWPPGVMVADIGMPGEDGYALIRKLRMLESERDGHIPAVALTAYARSEDRTRVLAAGFQMHVSKPVEALELVMVIASLADRRAMKA